MGSRPRQTKNEGMVNGIFAVRDDDICFFTDWRDLERLYGIYGVKCLSPLE